MQGTLHNIGICKAVLGHLWNYIWPYSIIVVICCVSNVYSILWNYDHRLPSKVVESNVARKIWKPMSGSVIYSVSLDLRMFKLMAAASGGSRSSSKGSDLYVSHFQLQLPATHTNNRLKVALRKQQLWMLIATDNGFNYWFWTMYKGVMVKLLRKHHY